MHRFSLVQSFSHVWLFVDPMDCSMPSFPVHHQLLELAQTPVHRVGDAIQPSHPVIPFSSCLQSLQASGSFQMSQFFISGGQSIGISALASVLLVNIQDWFPLGLTGCSRWSARDSQESSLTPQFKSINSLALSFLKNRFFFPFNNGKHPWVTCDTLCRESLKRPPLRQTLSSLLSFWKWDCLWPARLVV